MSARTAKKQFEDNFQFGHHATDPEKFNLYRGLANMADAIDRLQQEVAALRREVQALKR